MFLKTTFILSGLFLAFLAHSQDTTRTHSDSLTYKLAKNKKSIPNNLGLYFQASNMLAPTPAGQQESLWITSGLFIKKWQLGAFLSPYNDYYSDVLIFPNDFSLNYLYGGIFAGYTFYQNRWVDLSGTIAYGKGDIIWEINHTYENYYRDTYRMMHYLLDVELTPIRFVRPTIQLGYRQMSLIHMPNMTNSDFSGLSIMAGLRIGFYSKKPLK